jgi:hypothetical protein
MVIKLKLYINLYFYLKMLPSRAIKLISEYSKPVTRSDWRKSKPLVTQFNIYLFSISRNSKWSKLKVRIFCLILDTDWYYIFIFIKQYGLDQYYYHYGYNRILDMDGIMDADNWFREPSRMSW